MIRYILCLLIGSFDHTDKLASFSESTEGLLSLIIRVCHDVFHDDVTLHQGALHNVHEESNKLFYGICN